MHEEYFYTYAIVIMYIVKIAVLDETMFILLELGLLGLFGSRFYGKTGAFFSRRGLSHK